MKAHAIVNNKQRFKEMIETAKKMPNVVIEKEIGAEFEDI
jgi:hypothetical protein